MYICSFLSNRTNVPTRLLIITPTTNVYFRFYLGNHFLEYCTLLYLLLCNACRKMKIDIFDMDVEYGNSVIMNLCQVFIFSTERKLPNVPFFSIHAVNYKRKQWSLYSALFSSNRNSKSECTQKRNTIVKCNFWRFV